MEVLGQKAIPHPVEQLIQKIVSYQLADHFLAAGRKKRGGKNEKMRLLERKIQRKKERMKESFYLHI